MNYSGLIITLGVTQFSTWMDFPLWLLSIRINSAGTQAAECCRAAVWCRDVQVGQSRGSQAPQLHFKNDFLGYYEEFLPR